jgi:hypothetical protein
MFGRPTLRELFTEMREEARRRDEEMREFNREILLRNEKVYTSVIAQLEKNTARVHASTEETRSSIEETRVQTQALLRLIDRFDESGGAAAA